VISRTGGDCVGIAGGVGKSGICGGDGIELTHGGCTPVAKNSGAGGSGIVGSIAAKSFAT